MLIVMDAYSRLSWISICKDKRPATLLHHFRQAISYFCKSNPLKKYRFLATDLGTEFMGQLKRYIINAVYPNINTFKNRYEITDRQTDISLSPALPFSSLAEEYGIKIYHTSIGIIYSEQCGLSKYLSPVTLSFITFQGPHPKNSLAERFIR